MLWFGFCILDIAFHVLQWGAFSALSMQWAPLRDFGPSLALGMMSGLGLLSLLLQIGFLIEQPQLIPLFELCVFAIIIGVNRKSWRCLDDIRKRLVAAWQITPVTISVVLIALLYLFLHMTNKVLPPPVARAKSRLVSQKPDMPL